MNKFRQHGVALSLHHELLSGVTEAIGTSGPFSKLVPLPYQWGLWQKVSRIASRTRDELFDRRQQQEQALAAWQRYEDQKPDQFKDPHSAPKVDTYVPGAFHLSKWSRDATRFTCHLHMAKLLRKAKDAQSTTDNASAASGSDKELEPAFGVFKDPDFQDDVPEGTRFNTSSLAKPLVASRVHSTKTDAQKAESNARRTGQKQRKRQRIREAKAASKATTPASSTASVVPAPSQPQPGVPGREGLLQTTRPFSKELAKPTKKDEEEHEKFALLQKLCPRTSALYKDFMSVKDFTDALNIEPAVNVSPSAFLTSVNEILKQSACLADDGFAVAELKAKVQDIQDLKHRILDDLSATHLEMHAGQALPSPVPPSEEVKFDSDSDRESPNHIYDAATSLWFVSEGKCGFSCNKCDRRPCTKPIGHDGDCLCAYSSKRDCQDEFAKPGRKFMINPTPVTIPDDATTVSIMKVQKRLPGILCLQCGSTIQEKTFDDPQAGRVNCAQCNFDPQYGFQSIQAAMTQPEVLTKEDSATGSSRAEESNAELCGQDCQLFTDNTDGFKCLCGKPCTLPLGHAGFHMCSEQHLQDGVVNTLQSKREGVSTEVSTQDVLPRTVSKVSSPTVEMSNEARHLRRTTVPHDWTFEALLQNGAERVLSDQDKHPTLGRPAPGDCPDFYTMTGEIANMEPEAAPPLHVYNPRVSDVNLRQQMHWSQCLTNANRNKNKSPWCKRMIKAHQDAVKPLWGDKLAPSEECRFISYPMKPTPLLHCSAMASSCTLVPSLKSQLVLLPDPVVVGTLWMFRS